MHIPVTQNLDMFSGKACNSSCGCCHKIHVFQTAEHFPCVQESWSRKNKIFQPNTPQSYQLRLGDTHIYICIYYIYVYFVVASYKLPTNLPSGLYVIALATFQCIADRLLQRLVQWIIAVQEDARDSRVDLQGLGPGYTSAKLWQPERNLDLWTVLWLRIWKCFPEKLATVPGDAAIKYMYFRQLSIFHVSKNPDLEKSRFFKHIPLTLISWGWVIYIYIYIYIYIWAGGYTGTYGFYTHSHNQCSKNSGLHIALYLSPSLFVYIHIRARYTGAWLCTHILGIAILFLSKTVALPSLQINRETGNNLKN